MDTWDKKIVLLRKLHDKYWVKKERERKNEDEIQLFGHQLNNRIDLIAV